MTDLQKKLFELADPGYKQFQTGLLPDIDPATIIGVRTPALRKLAKDMSAAEKEVFLRKLPHNFYDENLLHALIISRETNFAHCAHQLVEFLPYVDNWAVCDQLRPKVFKENHDRLLDLIRLWIWSEHPFIVRFAVEMFMLHFLEDDFYELYAEWVARLRFDDYYVKMAVAWYFATALTKQYYAALLFIRQNRLDPWTHNKAIQKAVESRRIPAERKEYLKTLKIKEETKNG